MNKTVYTYVDEHSISPSLICPICLDILEEPHTHIPCDSAFCRSCLLQLMEPLCPICRWTWNDSLPLDYNIHLPKTNRLIRNMLDDLQVQCIHCHTIRRRGQFEHECKLTRKEFQETFTNIRMIFSIITLIFFLTLIYYYRNYVFENGIDRHNELIKEIGYNLDYILLEKLYYLIIKIIEYSITIFIINICLWFSIIIYGDYFLTKTISRILKNIFEITIIINLIIYSINNS
ncbi:unnamed protein product [Adineta steineri]|uniref:RING-type domain-containing protein n=1 Tax=Adineta steineri TaxID=433720 RepID=A0A813QYB7_9BILA|nr:unnamed protein product [Adineta steineri]CAF1176869.1 unnamed protein product [Adineta steineri]